MYTNTSLKYSNVIYILVIQKKVNTSYLTNNFKIF